MQCVLNGGTLSIAGDYSLTINKDQARYGTGQDIIKPGTLKVPDRCFFPPGTCGRGGKERASVIYQTLSVFHPRPSILCPLEMVG